MEQSKARELGIGNWPCAEQEDKTKDTVFCRPAATALQAAVSSFLDHQLCSTGTIWRTLGIRWVTESSSICRFVFALALQQHCCNRQNSSCVCTTSVDGVRQWRELATGTKPYIAPHMFGHKTLTRNARSHIIAAHNLARSATRRLQSLTTTSHCAHCFQALATAPAHPPGGMSSK